MSTARQTCARFKAQRGGRRSIRRGCWAKPFRFSRRPPRLCRHLFSLELAGRQLTSAGLDVRASEEAWVTVAFADVRPGPGASSRILAPRGQNGQPGRPTIRTLSLFGRLREEPMDQAAITRFISTTFAGVDIVI